MRSCNPVIQVGAVGGNRLAAPKSALRKGTSSVKENTSSAAAMTLHVIVPAIRQPCGRRYRRSRRYMRYRFGVNSDTGRMHSSGVTPPCRKDPR
jgi:hypothetical protein